MMRDKITSKKIFLIIFYVEKFRGFAFITYKDEETTDNVLEIDHELMGYQVSEFF